ncbi:MAG: MarR family transcriptional regulator [Anaerosporomusa subterranea]|nr:MarR family transcriptional regulator [Anaerosporomusa subterranea]
MNSMVFKKEMWDFLRTISEYMDSTFRPIVEEQGLTMMQTRILVEIKQIGYHTVGSVGTAIGLASGNASAMCKKLEKLGLIQRIRNPEDERCVNLTLTDLGVVTVQTIGDALEAKYGSFLENKPEDEFRAVIAGMKKLSSFIQEMSELSHK